MVKISRFMFFKLLICVLYTYERSFIACQYAGIYLTQVFPKIIGFKIFQLNPKMKSYTYVKYTNSLSTISQQIYSSSSF